MHMRQAPLPLLTHTLPPTPPIKPSAWSNKLITAKDHASVQINIGHLDADGVYSNAYTTLAFSGAVRQRVRRVCVSVCARLLIGNVVGRAWRGEGEWHRMN
jgi:hypothetical protein